MLKSMATELPRDTLDLLPCRVPSDCGGNRKKRFCRCQDRRQQWEGSLQSGQRWSRRWRPGFWSSITLGSLFQQRWYKKVKGLHEKKKIDDFSGTPKWCFNFMKREGLSMITWTKLAPKLPAAYEIKFWNFILMLSIFKRLSRTLNYPKSPVWMRSHSQVMCQPTELLASKEQRPWLLELVVVRKHISLLF